MNTRRADLSENSVQNGPFVAVVRVLAAADGWFPPGDGWTLLSPAGERPASGAHPAGDCWLVDDGAPPAVSADEMARSGLPIVVALRDDGGAVAPAWLDAADAFLFAGDPPAVMAAVLRDVVSSSGPVVRDLSDGTTRMINALSAEAGRIATQLAQLAEAQRDAPPSLRTVGAPLVRRMIKLRRDRDRFFPAEIFGDPAWDMLLDLIAAQLEHRQVPVSSLCIAACVPTTTALRWIRSLTEAGLFERQQDPADARRSHIRLTETAAAAMLAYLRAFSEAFAPR